MSSVPIESSLFPPTNPASDNPIESSCVTFRNEWIDNSACDSSIESSWIPLTDECPASGNLIEDDWHNDCIDNRDSEHPIESSCVPFTNGWIDNTDSSNDSKLIVVTKHSVEEGADAYRPGGFHPVFMGDVYNNRYEILRKIGYGQYSTVWLVRDLTEKSGSESEYRALKILTAESYSVDHPIYEREILKHLRTADISHPGYPAICHLVDDFEHQGPNGTHVCLVFELMGETLRTSRLWYSDRMLPDVVMRKFTFQLLLAFDYAHDSGIIHTDIQPDNIFIRFEDRSLIAKFLAQSPAIKQDRSAASYVPLSSESLRPFYFDTRDPRPLDWNVCLGDWGVSSFTNKHLTYLIQPVALRSPEVLIGAPWDWTTDWWNLGCVILEVFRGVRMFPGKESQYTPYSLKVHLKQIVNFFGPFPKSLLDQGDPTIVKTMFNDDGTIKDGQPGPHRKLSDDDYMGDLSQELRESFVGFLNTLMKVDPKERHPTQTLIDHPWIDLA